MAPGAKHKFGAPCSNLRSFGRKCRLLYWRNMWDIFGIFRRPQWFGAWGIVLLWPRRYATGVALRHIVCSLEIPRALNVEPLLRIDRSQLRWFGHVSRMPHKRLARQVLLAQPRESDPEVVQGPGGVITSPTLLGPVFLWSLQNYVKLMLTVRYSKATLPSGKAGMKMNEMNNIYVGYFLHRCLNVLS